MFHKCPPFNLAISLFILCVAASVSFQCILLSQVLSFFLSFFHFYMSLFPLNYLFFFTSFYLRLILFLSAFNQYLHLFWFSCFCFVVFVVFSFLLDIFIIIWLFFRFSTRWPKLATSPLVCIEFFSVLNTSLTVTWYLVSQSFPLSPAIWFSVSAYLRLFLVF